MTNIYRYNLAIEVPEAEQPTFHPQLITMLTNAKTAGKILSAKGNFSKIELPEEIDVS